MQSMNFILQLFLVDIIIKIEQKGIYSDWAIKRCPAGPVTRVCDGRMDLEMFEEKDL